MLYRQINWRPLLCGAVFTVFAVPAFAGFQVTASNASPTAMSKGQTVKLAASVQSSAAAGNMIVDLEVYNAAGAKVGQTFYQGQNFAAGQSLQYAWMYQLPTNAATGKYTFKVGVFTPGWSSDVYWNNAAASFSMSSTAGTATQGVCGAVNGQSLGVAPTGNLCSVGVASAVSGSGPWTWNCAGGNGGATASCSASPVSSGPPPTAGGCGMQLGSTPAIFCDTFNAPATTGTRSGQLNGNVWGVSRFLGDVNFGQRDYDAAPATALVGCGGTTTVRPPNDVIICNGQLREATNDNASGVYDAGTVTVLAMYPKQPFDFAGRTGTVSFDVSNDTHGEHAVWPEFWMSDLPVPTPFTHFEALGGSVPQNGFGIRFAGSSPAGQFGICPTLQNYRRWTVDSAIVVRNYVIEDKDVSGNLVFGANTGTKIQILDCVRQPADNSGVLNHVELRISQNQIDVYATDAGVAATPATLKHIAVITKANLTLTRGLIWMEDVHYNADKAEVSASVPSQRQHTFVWDNVAFDGPFTDRDFAYDALDANQPTGNFGTWSLGKESPANQTSSWDVLNVPANPKPAGVRVLFNFNNEQAPTPTVLTAIVNGHAHTVAWPFPDKTQDIWRTLAITIPVTDLVPGTNVVQLGSNSAQITANVDIVLAGVPGGVPVLPGSNDAYP
jgi:hypothetical protein